MTLEEFQARFVTQDGTVDRALMGFNADPTPEMLEKHTPLPTASDPHPKANAGAVRVEFDKSRGVGIADFKKFVRSIQADTLHTGILITMGAITPSALKLIPTVLPRIIETFNEQDLLVNVTEHELVPKHVLLSPADKRALLERYRVKETQLPRIQMADPVAKYLGLRRGQVVKIIRRSETAGRYASYRWCI